MNIRVTKDFNYFCKLTCYLIEKKGILGEKENKGGVYVTYLADVDNHM